MIQKSKKKKKSKKAKKDEQVQEKIQIPYIFFAHLLYTKYTICMLYHASIHAIVCPVQSMCMYCVFFLSDRRRICYCSLLTYKTNQSGLSILLYLGRWYESDTCINVCVRYLCPCVRVAMVQDLKIFLVNDFVCPENGIKR